jgi:hypothetical protein
MAEINPPEMIIIAPPGRKRDNLAIFVVSVMGSNSIRIVETISQAEEFLFSSKITHILVDNRNQSGEIEREIEIIQGKNPAIRIVLLQNQPGRNNLVTSGLIREMVYGDISIAMLNQLLSKDITNQNMSENEKKTEIRS